MMRPISPGPEILRRSGSDIAGRMSVRSPTFVPRVSSPVLEPTPRRSNAFVMSGEAAFDSSHIPTIEVTAPRRQYTAAEVRNLALQHEFILGIVKEQLRMFRRGTAAERPDAAETLLELVMSNSSLHGWVRIHMASAIADQPEVQKWLSVPGYTLDSVIVSYLAYCAYCN